MNAATMTQDEPARIAARLPNVLLFAECSSELTFHSSCLLRATHNPWTDSLGGAQKVVRQMDAAKFQNTHKTSHNRCYGITALARMNQSLVDATSRGSLRSVDRADHIANRK